MAGVPDLPSSGAAREAADSRLRPGGLSRKHISDVVVRMGTDVRVVDGVETEIHRSRPTIAEPKDRHIRMTNELLALIDRLEAQGREPKADEADSRG